MPLQDLTSAVNGEVEENQTTLKKTTKQNKKIIASILPAFWEHLHPPCCDWAHPLIHTAVVGCFTSEGPCEWAWLTRRSGEQTLPALDPSGGQIPGGWREGGSEVGKEEKNNSKGKWVHYSKFSVVTFPSSVSFLIYSNLTLNPIFKFMKLYV